MGDKLDKMKKAVNRPRLNYPLIPKMGTKSPATSAPPVATLPPGEPPKRVCRRCGMGFADDKALAEHDCPNPKLDHRTAAGRDRRLEGKGRLPDGSLFMVQYDKARNVWNGTLTVHLGEGDVRPKASFHGEAEGVFRLLAELDDKYRAWLARQDSPVPPPQEAS